jgi:hypothetical protein
MNCRRCELTVYDAVRGFGCSRKLGTLVNYTSAMVRVFDCCKGSDNALEPRITYHCNSEVE